MNQISPKIARNQPCPCGSGRKYKHCCSAQADGSGVAAERGTLQQAFELHQRGWTREAAIRYEQILRKQPRNAQARYLLGHLRLQAGEWESASRDIGQAISDGLSDAAAHYYLGLANVQGQRLDLAIAAFEAALKLKPDFEEARNNLANAYFELRDFDHAEPIYHEAIARNGANWRALHNLGHVHYFQGRINEAIERFREAVLLVPNEAEVRASLATLLEVNNAPEEAEREANVALRIAPGNASARVVIAKVLRRRRRCQDALDALDTIDDPTAAVRTQVTIWSERGENLDRLGRYPEAFAAFARSKEALTEVSGSGYERRKFEQPLDDAETYFTRSKLADLNTGLTRSGSEVLQPIFVVGFHRSGTTLVEQMLSSHPRITAAGELEWLPRFEASLGAECGVPYPYCLDRLLADGALDRLLHWRREYLSRLRTEPIELEGKRWVIDKLPFNMLRLPLIRLLFPDSPVVHMVRHPMDTVLSSFFQAFLHGNEWSRRLPDAAALYVRTARHVERMTQVLDIRYRRVRYEDLVADPESELRPLLDFVGETWDPACLHFYENRRVARTASYEQVTRKLYSGSIGRYRNYADLIDSETQSLLAPIVAELGYRLDAATMEPR